jgi:tetratricopeptide (TPR) repeat protein
MHNKIFLAGVILVIAGIFVYFNVLDGDFIWDDESFVLNNEFIRSFKNIPRFFTDPGALASGGISKDSYRPLVPFSFSFDYSLWGLDPFGYHLANILFHIFNAFLVFLIARYIIKRYIPSLFAALVFLVHPVQAEAVSWIAGRSNLIFLLFYLASMLMFIKYDEQEHTNFALYGFSLISFGLSLLCREMAVSLPLILILYTAVFRYARQTGRVIREMIPFFILITVFVIARFKIIGSVAQGDWWSGDAFTTFLTMLTGILYYLKVLVWPVSLCADHLTFPVVRTFLNTGVILSMVLILLLFSSVYLFLRRKARVLPFGIVWFFLTLGPVLNIIPLKILVADRFLYLPVIGYCLALASFMCMIIKIKSLRYVLFAGIIVFYAAFTLSRNNVWADELAFYSDIVGKYDDNVRAGVNLSLACKRQGRLNRAIREAKRVLRYDENNYKARMLLSDYYLRKNKSAEAGKALEPLFAKNAGVDVLLRRAKIYLSMGMEDKALEIYNKLRTDGQSLVYADIGMARVFLLKGEKEKAVREIKNILKGKNIPDGYRALAGSLYLMLGDIYLSSGEKREACNIWEEMKNKYPDQKISVFIADFMNDNISEKEYLNTIKYWPPDIKAVGYYFFGSKIDSLGNKEKADKYFNEASDTKNSSAVFIKRLAEKRVNPVERAEATGDSLHKNGLSSQIF